MYISVETCASREVLPNMSNNIGPPEGLNGSKYVLAFCWKVYILMALFRARKLNIGWNNCVGNAVDDH